MNGLPKFVMGMAHLDAVLQALPWQTVHNYANHSWPAKWQLIFVVSQVNRETSES